METKCFFDVRALRNDRLDRLLTALYMSTVVRLNEGRSQFLQEGQSTRRQIRHYYIHETPLCTSQKKVRCSALFARKPAAAADRSPKISVFTGVVGVAVSSILDSVRSCLVRVFGEDVKRSCTIVPSRLHVRWTVSELFGWQRMSAQAVQLLPGGLKTQRHGKGFVMQPG